MQEFSIDVVHVKGSSMADVDGPSRAPLTSTCPYGEEVEPLYDTLVLFTTALVAPAKVVEDPPDKRT